MRLKRLLSSFGGFKLSDYRSDTRQSLDAGRDGQLLRIPIMQSITSFHLQISTNRASANPSARTKVAGFPVSSRLLTASRLTLRLFRIIPRPVTVILAVSLHVRRRLLVTPVTVIILVLARSLPSSGIPSVSQPQLRIWSEFRHVDSRVVVSHLDPVVEGFCS